MEKHTNCQVGDRVRLTCDCVGGYTGEEGRVLAISRGAGASLESLTIFIDGEPHRTRGTTVYPHEVELVDTGAAPAREGEL